jgi:alanyl-tRNA synthetase
MTAKDIINIYISFFEKRGHKQIPNSPLIPENDPTTLFTSSGMQPLVPYLMGETHPLGQRLVNVQNCFRAVDIDEVGDNRHNTFFRMLGNWSLGDYFKKEEIPWVWELLTKEFGLPKEKLFITIFKGTDNNVVKKDNEAYEIWREILNKSFGSPQDFRISWGGDSSNWWSRSGEPKNMPIGEIGGPDTEVFYDFGTPHDKKFGNECHPNCQCGRFFEIGNAVFIQFAKTTPDAFKELPQKNVDYGGGIERLLAAIENSPDVFQTSLFKPIVEAIEEATDRRYLEHKKEMQIICDHLSASVFIASANIKPSKTEQGYILRRLLRRSFDNFKQLDGKDISPVIEKVVEQYSVTDPVLEEKFEEIKLTILEEEQGYKKTIHEAVRILTQDKQDTDDSTSVAKEISADEAFRMYSTHGLSPTQIKSLGYIFNEQEFAQKMEEHQKLSREGAGKRFKGGLADTSDKTIAGHTATHLLHKALKLVLGENVNQAGSNITNERIRFDFSHNEKLSDDQIAQIEKIVNEKIAQNLPVESKTMSLEEAKKLGAVGLFEKKYEDTVKVYLVGDFSSEICGGPHVDFTGRLKSFKIIKQENVGKGLRRIYAKVG